MCKSWNGVLWQLLPRHGFTHVMDFLYVFTSKEYGSSFVNCFYHCFTTCFTIFTLDVMIIELYVICKFANSAKCVFYMSFLLFKLIELFSVNCFYVYTNKFNLFLERKKMEKNYLLLYLIFFFVDKNVFLRKYIKVLLIKSLLFFLLLNSETDFIFKNITTKWQISIHIFF